MATIYVVTLLALFVASTGAFPPYNHLLPLLTRRGAMRNCDFERCVNPIKQWQHPTTGFKLQSVDSSQALGILCGDLQTAVSCVTSLVRDGCGSGNEMETDLMLRTIEGVVGYMCGDEGRAALLSETDCWENEELEGGIQDCADQMTDGVMITNPNQICGLVDGFRNCTVGVVGDLCSQTAVRFADGIMYYAIQPVAEGMLNCQVRQRIRRDMAANLMHLLKK